MAKKRQQDFVKTQLKPGRTLTRRKTVTPSVKTKKIVLPKKHDNSPLTIQAVLDTLKNFKAGSISNRVLSLQRLEALIDSEQVTFYIAEIFYCLSHFVLDQEASIRTTAIKVCEKIFEKKDVENLKTKMLSVSDLLIHTLKTGMCSTAIKVRSSTLFLLSIILEHHPDLISNSLDVLKSFHNLIFITLRKLSHQSAKSDSVVPMLHDGQIDNENYRIQVFDTLKLFLKEMLKHSETDIVEDSDEQEIHWNCEGPLHLEIYAGGGLKPFDIEKSLNHFNSQMLHFDSSIIDDFVIPIISLIRQTFFEEIPSQLKANDNLQNKSIQNINILMQVLCHITELIQSVPCEEVDQQVRRFLLEDIYKRGLFPFNSTGVFDTNQRPEAIELNLAVCILHNRFILQANFGKDDYNKPVMTYIKTVAKMPYHIKKPIIPILVKVLKIYFSLTDQDQISDFVVDNLNSMAELLKVIGRPVKHLKNASKTANKDTNKDVLISLFFKLSLHPAYDFLIETTAMETWFKWLLSQLVYIPINGKIDKNILHAIKIISNRKYPSFLNALTEIDDNRFKALLKNENPHVRDTVIFLIYNMENVSGSLLEDISNVILLDASFPSQYAIRFIRLLTCRFTETPQVNEKNLDISAFRRGRADFIQFLLNVAIDSLNLTTDKWINYEANEYVKALKPFKDVTAYNIFPSLQWKEHSKLFDVCQKSLSLLPQKLVSSIAMLMLKEVLDHTKNLPVHCTIAILKLNNWDIKDRHYRFQLDNLIFSSLLTISVLTAMTVEDEWYTYNIVELMDSMEFNRRLALETLQRQLERSAELNGITVYYILRICKFYLDRGLFKPDDGERVLNILERFKDKCSDKTISQQPVYIHLYNIFYFYA